MSVHVPVVKGQLGIYGRKCEKTYECIFPCTFGISNLKLTCAPPEERCTATVSSFTSEADDVHRLSLGLNVQSWLKDGHVGEHLRVN